MMFRRVIKFDETPNSIKYYFVVKPRQLEFIQHWNPEKSIITQGQQWTLFKGHTLYYLDVDLGSEVPKGYKRGYFGADIKEYHKRNIFEIQRIYLEPDGSYYMVVKAYKSLLSEYENIKIPTRVMKTTNYDVKMKKHDGSAKVVYVIGADNVLKKIKQSKNIVFLDSVSNLQLKQEHKVFDIEDLFNNNKK